LNFEKERTKIIRYIDELELVVRLSFDYEVSSSGNAFGWDFFQIYFDPLFIAKLTEIYQDIINEEGVTVIAITHFMHEAAEGNRVIVMEAGKIVMSGTPRQVFAHVEELRGLQLDVPQTTELAYRLNQRDSTFPPDLLLVNDVADEVQRRVNGRGGA